MADRSYIVKAAGKDFRFTPGKNSSYIQQNPDPMTPPTLSAPPQRAKVIMPPVTNGSDPMKSWQDILTKRKSKVIPTKAPATMTVGASRG